MYSRKMIRMGVLLCFISLGFLYVVASGPVESAAVRPCCSTCPGAGPDGSPPTDLTAYCATQCPSGSRSCVSNCVQEAELCWSSCYICSGGGSTCGQSCSSSLDCMNGVSSCTFCIGGTCQ